MTRDGHLAEEGILKREADMNDIQKRLLNITEDDILMKVHIPLYRENGRVAGWIHQYKIHTIEEMVNTPSQECFFSILAPVTIYVATHLGGLDALLKLLRNRSWSLYSGVNCTGQD